MCTCWLSRLRIRFHIIGLKFGKVLADTFESVDCSTTTTVLWRRSGLKRTAQPGFMTAVEKGSGELGEVLPLNNRCKARMRGGWNFQRLVSLRLLVRPRQPMLRKAGMHIL